MLHKINIVNKNKRSIVFVKWMISYLGILIIPLLIGSYYYTHSLKVIKNETMVRQHLSLDNVKTQLDSYLNNLVRISTNLQMNQYVNSLSYKDASSSDFHMQLIKLKEDLSIYMVTNNFIKEIYIYFPDNDYIVSSSTCYSNEYTSFLPSRYISEETWQFLYDNLYLNTYQFGLFDQEEEKLLLSLPLYINRKTDLSLSIITFELNQKSFTDLLDGQLLTYNFSGLTLMKDYSVLLSTSKDLAVQLKPNDITKSDSSSTTRSSVSLKSHDKKKDTYIIDSVDLLLSDVKLVSLTEESLYNTVSSHMLSILFIVLFVSILIGTLITFLFTVINYRPLKEIMGYIKDVTSDTEEKNEYRKIKNMIIKSNNEKITQQNLLKNNYLYKLLIGEIQPSQVSSTIAERFQLNFPSDASYVVLIRCSELRLKQSDSPDENDKMSKYELAFFITKNILCELLEPFLPHLHFCHNQAETIMIVNIRDEDEKNEHQLMEVLDSFINYCQTHFDLTFFIGVSELCDNKHLSDAYAQANNTLEYMHLFSNGNLLPYKNTPKASQIEYLELKNADYIINLVMTISEQALEDYFNNIDQELNKRKLSSDDAKSCLYFFYNVSMRLKARLQYQYPYSSIENIFVLDSHFFNSSLLEAIHYIESLFLNAVKLIQEQDTNSTDKKIQEVAQYIESNYFDINLNLNNIADHFNITPSYLSKKFRDEYGISIIDYLYKIRISYSIKLIKDTSLKITDIAQMVGFQDSNAFIRIFKKYYGCTPGKYKTSSMDLSETPM